MSVKICLPVSHHFESKEKVQKLRDLDLYDFLEVRPSKIDYKEDIEKQKNIIKGCPHRQPFYLLFNYCSKKSIKNITNFSFKSTSHHHY